MRARKWGPDLAQDKKRELPTEVCMLKELSKRPQLLARGVAVQEMLEK